MPSALITPQELQTLLDSDKEHIRVLDASYPARPGAPVIGAARVFDIDAVADHTSPLPHTLPDANTFAAAVGALGIGNTDTVIVYDQSGIMMAAARAWWMFRVFGHADVRILDGGSPAWRAAGLPVGPAPVESATPVPYTAQFQPRLFTDRAFILANLQNPKIQIADARPGDRFAGNTPDLRPGVPTGHIPGSVNVPAGSLVDPATGRLRHGDARIQTIIQHNPGHIVASCGSGVTACVLALALHEAGLTDVPVYDGSWAEWATQPNAPMETGPGKNPTFFAK